MAKAKTPHQTLTPRWVLPSVIGALLLFTAFEAHQMASAQTSAFTNPSCDPSTNANCNPAAPLFLSPTDKTVQIVETPIQIGKSTGVQDIMLFGSLTLSATSDVTKKIQTAANYSGQAINVTSTTFAIVGNSSGATTAGIQGNGQGTGPGVWATSQTGSALLAQNGSSGYAGQFEGQVKMYPRTGGITDTTKFALFTVNPDGNLNIGISAAGKGLLVNGAPVASSISVTDSATGSQTKFVDLKPSFGTSNAYTLTGVQVLYWDTTQTGNNKDWKPMPAANVTYNECVAGAFTAGLTLVNPIANAVNYRIFIAYSTTTVVCPGTDTTPPTISLGGDGVSTGVDWWVGGPTNSSQAVPLSVDITDASGVKLSSVDFKIDFPSANTSIAGTVTTIGNKYTIQAPAWTQLQNTGAGLTRRNITVYACDNASNCATSAALPLRVTVNENYNICQANRCFNDDGSTSSCCLGVCQSPLSTCGGGTAEI